MKRLLGWTLTAGMTLPAALVLAGHHEGHKKAEASKEKAGAAKAAPAKPTTKAKEAKGKGTAEEPQRIAVSLSTKGNDIAFDQTAVQIPFGKNLILTFENKANAGSGIVHNIALLKPGSTEKVIEAFTESEYNVEAMKKHPMVLAITPSLDPGQSSELLLTKEMLKEPGYYPYICLMPGHADMLGMEGVMHVAK